MATGTPFEVFDLHETFDKPDTSVVGPNYAWQEHAVTAAGDLVVASNRLSATSADNSTIRGRANADVGAGDMKAQVTVHVLASTAHGNASVGPQARCSSTDTAIADAYGMEVHNADKYFFWKRVAGTTTYFVNGAALALGTLPGVAAIEVQGSTVRAYWRGSLLFTQTDTAIAGDAGHIRAGVLMFQPNSSTVVDDWRATRLPRRFTMTTERTLAMTGTTKGAGWRVGKLAAGTVAPAGAIVAQRLVERVFTGAIGMAGAVVRRPARTTTGALRPAGTTSASVAAVRTGRLALRGTAKGAGWRVSKLAAGTIPMAGTAVAAFLGRVVGRAGIVVMAVRAAGSIRLRVRRPN